jgi:hypothetical protein
MHGAVSQNLGMHAAQTTIFIPEQFVFKAACFSLYPFAVAAMPSWTAADMIKEIQNIGKLWKARGVTKVADAMVDNAVRKLKSLVNVEASSAIQLYQAIDDAQLEATLKNKLSEAVDELITAEVHAADEARGGNGQRLCTPFNYLTKGDWDKIDNEASYWSIIYVVVERFKKVGLSAPMAESTVKWTAATLVANTLERTGKMPSYDAIYQLTKDLKQSLKSCQVNCHPDLQKPRVYPESATQLGDAFMAQAYDPDDPPVQRYSDRVSCLVTDHIPVRETSKLLAKNQKKGNAVTAADVAKEIMKAQQADEGGCNITFLHKPALGTPQPKARLLDFDSQASGSQDAPIAARAVDLFQPKIRMNKPTPTTPAAVTGGPEHLAIVDGPKELEAPKEEPKKSTCPALESAEDFESAAFEALAKAAGAARVIKKRPAAKSEPPKTKPMAKAGSKHVAKAVPKPKAKAGALKLGCKSCRGNSGGCKTCRKPNFGGWRGTPKQYYDQGGKHHK